MYEQVAQFLHSQPVLVFFLVLSLGYLFGRFEVWGISLGAAGGVLLAGLLFGHFGFDMYPAIQTLGFAIFIFCVGYQAGPQFFDVLLTSGLKYLSLALVVAVTGFFLTVVLSGVLGFQPGISAGLLGGALTTTPTLAAAQDAVRSGLFDVPDGLSAETVLTNIGAGYALTYLFGLIGLILTIRLLPRLLKIDLAAEAASLEADGPGQDGVDLSQVTARTYRVTREEMLHHSVADIERTIPGTVVIVGVRRGGEIIELDHDDRLEVGDEALVVGRVDRLLDQAALFGEEIADEEGLGVSMSTFQVVVSNPEVIGKPISDIRLARRIGALPVRVRRLRTDLPLKMDMVLKRGDVITFFGPDIAVDRLVSQVGHVERDVVDTDLFTFGLGIAAGIVLGTLAITLGGIRIELGMAGGLLITGLLIGFLRSIYPVFGRVPSASRWVLMELGLLMFMAGVGLNAGGGIVEIIERSGGKLIGAGILVTLVPICVGYAFSRKILRLNPAEALGGVTGSMTSGAALSVVCDAAKSNVPALGYTGAYAFANVILTLAGTFIMLI
jgi:putative transport protein